MPPNTTQQSMTAQLSCEVLTQADVADRVKQGEILVIFENKVYKLDQFLHRHPGGVLAIQHMVGKDVTDEIRSLHPPVVYNCMIKQFYIGEFLPECTYPSTPVIIENTPNVIVPDADQANVYDHWIASLYHDHADTQVQDQLATPRLDRLKIRQAYRRLEQEILDRGLFQCNYYRYAKEVCRYVFLLYLSVWFCLRGSAPWHYFCSATCLAMFWHQLVFTAHDAGHNGITGRVEIDHVIGVIIADFIGGLSLGWWKDNHYVHHIVTNHPEHDPDIQHLPFFAITHRFFKNLYSTYYNRILPFDAVARFLIPRQHYYYYLVLMFGRFNLHRLSFIHLLFSPNVRTRTLEWIGIACFFVWYGTLVSYVPTVPLRIAYVLISYAFTFTLHVQITLSHFGMSTEDLGPNELFPAKMLRTTMDVDCPEWMDWFHGGLQYQVIHHLFPRVPRHNLRLCVPLVRRFCKETSLRYYSYDFATGNGVILGCLKAVADQARFMNNVAVHNAKTWVGDSQSQD